MVIKKKGYKNWEYCLYLGQDKNGKKKYKRKCGFATKSECLKECLSLNDKFGVKNIKRKTFKDVCITYIEDCKNRKLRTSTINYYENLFNILSKDFKYLNKSIDLISTNDINNYMAISSSKINNPTFVKIIIFLKMIFKFALKNNFIKNNILSDINVPRYEKQPINIWSKEEIQSYLPILQNFRYYNLVLLALETGLRIGELVALTWDCIDLTRNVITVKKSYVCSGKTCYFSYPKTKAGIRQIVLLKKSASILKDMFKTHTSNYVFPHSCDTKCPVHPRTVSKQFIIFLKKNNLKPIRFHDLRHTHATLLLNNNIDYKILSKRLGHTDIAFTLQTYTHIVPENEIRLFKSLSKIF